MDIAFFNAKSYDREVFERANHVFKHNIHFIEPHLNQMTAHLVQGEKCVCAFINDTLDRPVLELLKHRGVELVALRSAGFNHVDLDAAKELDLPVVRVPAYSPYATAEYAVGLLLVLNRRLHRAFNRVREGDFSINGLMGFDIHGKTVGIIGTGKIGEAFARIMVGFGARVIAYDVYTSPECKAMGVEYVSLDELYAQSDIISLHCPLVEATQHIIDADAIAKMKTGVTILNTSRGRLLDTRAVIAGLKDRKIGFFGLDVYEEEESMFFEDLSDDMIQDDVFARLLTFPNVLATSHQAFFTREAVSHIAETTLKNIRQYENKEPLVNAI
jgi:D-lactate dehydrogenase